MQVINYNIIKTGEIAGSLSIEQLPDIPCVMVKIKAKAGNSGKVYIGGSSVTVVDGTTDTTTGYQLAASADTDWLYVGNLNQLYAICDTGGDGLVYIALMSKITAA